MNKNEKTLRDVLSGKKDANIKFNDLRNMLNAMGFRCDIRGDHYIYRKNDTPIINIQPEGKTAKEYQVRQIRNIITDYDLGV